MSTDRYAWEYRVSRYIVRVGYKGRARWLVAHRYSSDIKDDPFIGGRRRWDRCEVPTKRPMPNTGHRFAYMEPDEAMRRMADNVYHYRHRGDAIRRAKAIYGFPGRYWGT